MVETSHKSFGWWLSAIILSALTGGILWVSFWPVPFEAEIWYPIAPANNPLYAENNKLNAAQIITTGAGPEAIAVDHQSNIYTGLSDGRIMRYTPKGDAKELTNTQGRPLGLKFDKHGNLVIADGRRGLLVYYMKDAKLVVLANQYDDKPIKFADDLDITDDGTVWFSDASQQYTMDETALEQFSQKPTGRLMAYMPETGRVEVALDNLAFANGIARAADNSFILVNETYRHRVRRLWLTGSQAGTSDIFIDNLPGYPDNITRAPDGGFWIAIIAPRSEFFDYLASRVFIRKILWRLSTLGLQAGGAPPRIARAIKIAVDGTPITSLDDTSGKINGLTSVLEHNQKLYLGQLFASGIGVLSLPIK